MYILLKFLYLYIILKKYYLLCCPLFCSKKVSIDGINFKVLNVTIDSNTPLYWNKCRLISALHRSLGIEDMLDMFGAERICLELVNDKNIKTQIHLEKEYYFINGEKKDNFMDIIEL